MAPLSDRKCQTAQPGERTVKLSDGAGLQLWIMPTGAKLWRLAYRYAGKQKLLAIGPYPVISLAAARVARDDAKRTLAGDGDPSQVKRERKAARAEAQTNTFAAVADELEAKKKQRGIAPATAAKREWLVTMAKAKLGALPVANITAVDILRMLQPLEADGKLDTAKRLRGIIGEVCRYAEVTGRASGDPTRALRGAIAPPKPKPMAAITDPMQFGGMLRAIDGFQGQPTTRAALQLMALLGCRPGELRKAKWTEFDLEGRVWNIPAERMKARKAHRVPLPQQAVGILKDLYPVTGHGVGGLVFPGLRSVLQPISEATMNVALRRMGYSQEEATSHGFRSTFSTLANESGKWSVNAIEAALAHIEPNAVRRAYARGDYWDERVKMMTWWADYLDKLRKGGRVVPFKQAGDSVG